MAQFEKMGNGYLGKFETDPGSNKPPYKGKLFLKNADGSESKLELAAWIKEKDDGTKFFSLSVSRNTEEGQPQPQKDSSSPPDEEIPF